MTEAPLRTPDLCPCTSLDTDEDDDVCVTCGHGAEEHEHDDTRCTVDMRPWGDD